MKKAFVNIRRRDLAWALISSHTLMLGLLGAQLWWLQKEASRLHEGKVPAKIWKSINNLPNVTNGIAQIDDIAERSEKWRKLSSILAHNWVHSEKAQHSYNASYETFVEGHKNICLYGFTGILLIGLIAPIWLWLHRNRPEESRLPESSGNV
jgi:hypothetical protein